MKNYKPFDPFRTVQRLVASIVTLCATLGACADEYTDAYGQTWTYEVISGTNVRLIGVRDKTLAYDAANFPWIFTDNDTNYRVTEIGTGNEAYNNGVFQKWTALRGTLTIPDFVTLIGLQAFERTGIERIASPLGGDTLIKWRAFSSITKLSGAIKLNKEVSLDKSGGLQFDYTGINALYAPGPDTGTRDITVYQTFSYCDSLKVVFMGPNTKAARIKYAQEDHPWHMLSTVTEAYCKVFVPSNGNWDGFEPGGENNEAIFYGANTNLNLIVDDDAGTITAIPTDGAAFAKMLEVAPTLKECFGWDAKINVTNMIEVTDGVITAENAQWVNSFNSIVFKVNTQAQLNTLLAAIPSSIPFAINPADSREELTVPQGREVYVKLSAEGRNGKYTPKVYGMTIICR